MYERAHAREHGRNITIQEDWRLYQDHTVGDYRENRHGADERDTTTLGPLTYERGVLRGVHWEQNRNGIVYTFPAIHQARDAASDRALRDPGDDRDVRLVGESLAPAAYVVEVNPRDGHHTWYFIDKRTGYVDRTDVIRRRRRYTTTFDDYKVVDGVGEPSRVRTLDSLGNEREQILVTRTIDDTPDPRDVDMPANRSILEFPDRTSGAIRLPVRFVNGLAVVRVLAGKNGYDFLLDSGAAGLVVDPSVVDQLGLERYGMHVGSTMGTFPESTTILPQLTAGGLRMRNVVARVVQTPFHVDEHTRIAGLLGFDFFADAVVHVDVTHAVFEVTPPDRFRPPSDASAVAIALTDKTPAVHLRAGTAMARAVLDTGANRSMFLTAYADRADFGPERVASLTRVRGVGGLSTAEATRLPQIALAGIDTRNATVDVTNADIGSEDVDGIIGTDLLRSYDLWFDYRANTVFVRRPVELPARKPAFVGGARVH